MTPPKKSPTNADLAEEIRDLKKMVSPLLADVAVLKDWKMAEDAYKAARLQLKEEEREDTRDQVWRQTGKILGLVVLALGAYLAGKGIQ